MVNDIEQTKESRAPQYQESGEGGEKKAHRSASTETDADRSGEGRRQGSQKEAIALEIAGAAMITSNLSPVGASH